MLAATELELPEIAIFSEAFESDPFPIYAAARAEHWLARCEMGFAVLSYDAASRFLRDPRFLMPGQQVAMMLGATEGPWQHWLANNILGTQAQAHVRLRRLVSPVFTPTQAEARRAIARQIFDETLEPLLSESAMDVVEDLCAHFPVRVLCRLIGVDDADLPKFQSWARTMGSTFDMKPDVVPALNAAVAGMWEYVDAMLTERSASRIRRDDLLQALIEASEDGDRLSRDELLNLVVTMLAGGADTTGGAFALMIYTLLTRDGQWDRIAADPALVNSAVEEGLRYRPVASAVPRIALEDVEYGGVVIPEGSFLLIAIAAANRDPEIFREPHEFEVARSEAKQVATFGLGPHYCLGANIARVELQVALTGLIEKIVSPRISGEVRWKNPLGVWGPRSLPITYGLR